MRTGSLSLFLFLVGCATGGWQIPADFETRPATPTIDPVLQVIVAYGRETATHTALRLVEVDGSVTFWDPGGEYPDLPDRTYNRRRDVIRDRPETLERYWDYRLQLGENRMLVFEWQLPHSEIAHLASLLRQPSSDFDPETQSGFCARAAADFLTLAFNDNAEPVPSTFSPDTLARHLWTRQPSRVLLFKRGTPPTAAAPGKEK